MFCTQVQRAQARISVRQSQSLIHQRVGREGGEPRSVRGLHPKIRACVVLGLAYSERDSHHTLAGTSRFLCAGSTKGQLSMDEKSPRIRQQWVAYEFHQFDRLQRREYKLLTQNT